MSWSPPDDLLARRGATASLAGRLLPPGLRLVEVEDMPSQPPRRLVPGREKLVYFVRHGQSIANIVDNDEERMSVKLYDACLTEEGERQAESLRDVVSAWGVHTVYASPLTRALQTACIAFADQPHTPIVAWPVITEFYPHMPECQGRVIEDLQEAKELSKLARFQDVRLDGVGDGWWKTAGDRVGRLRSFLQWLASTPETRVAVVAHWGFLYELLVLECKTSHSLSLTNCSYVRTIWSVEPSVPIHAPLHGPRLYGVQLQLDGTAQTDRGQQLHNELTRYFGNCARDPLLQNAYSMRFGGRLFVELADFRAEPDDVSLTALRGRLITLTSELRAACPGDQRWHPAEEALEVQVREGRNPVVRLSLQNDELLEKFAKDLAESIFPHRGGNPGVARAPFYAEILGTHLYEAWSPTGPLELEHYRQAAQGLPLVEALLGHKDSAELKTAIAAFTQVNWHVALVSHGAENGLDLRTEATFAI